MKDVKIVFTDLDSTLTVEEGKIDEKNRIIFEKLSNIGINVVISTGRSLPYTIPICKKYMTSNYIITSNGAEIYNYLANKVIYKNVINKDNLEFLNNIIKKYDLFFTANTIEKRYTNKKENNKGCVVCNSLDEINDEISQVVVQSYDLDNMKLVRKEIEDTNALRIANKTKNIEEGKLLYYDIVNIGASKGDAVKKLCDYLNIDTNKALAIGDSLNDIDMLEAVGYKACVNNASPEVKEIANIVTLSNKENGVLVILNELYKEKIK